MKIFRKGLSLLLATLIVLSCWVWVDPAQSLVASAADTLKNKYLFAYFTGTSKEGQTIHLAVSEDGYNYTALRNNEPVIIPSKGVGNVRDPYIWYNEQDNYYYILATDLDFTDGGGDYSNNSQSFIIWRSKDLVNWYDETFIDVSKMAHLIGDTRNMSAVWAPQVLWDGSAYVVYFTLACNATSWFDIVYLKTTDLMDPNAYYEFDYILGNETGNGVCDRYGVIDADIIHNPGDGKYYLFYKTECNGHELGSTATGTSLKTIHYYVGDTPTGPFRNPGDTKWTDCGFSIFPDYNVSLEGCNSFFDNEGNLIMYADEFEHKNASGEAEAYFHIAKSNGYDFTSWSYPDVSQHNINSLSPRHGSVVKITTEEYNRLLNNSYNITSSSYPDTEVLKDHLVAQYFTTNDVLWNNVMGQPNLASSTGITMFEDESRGWYAKFDETSGGWAEVDFDSLFLKTGGLNYEDGFTITFSARLQPNETVNNENNDRIYEIADVFGSRTGTEHYTHFSPGGGGNGSYLGNYNGPVDSGNDWLNDINRANRDDKCFHEYIISYATGNVMVYVDGQLVISRNRFTGVKLDDSWYEALGSNATMRIGRSGWDADPLFKGNIQNLCIYDCSMSYYDAQSMNDDYKENLGWVGENTYNGITSKVPTFQNTNADRMNSLPNKEQHFSNILYTSETVKNYDGNNMSADSAVWHSNGNDFYFALYYPETTVLLYDGVKDAIMPVSFGAYCENSRANKGFLKIYPTNGPGSTVDLGELEISQNWGGWYNNGDYYECIVSHADGYIGRNSTTSSWSHITDKKNYDCHWGAPLKVNGDKIKFGDSYYKKFNLTWQVNGGTDGNYAADHSANMTSDNDIYVINFKPILDLRNTITEAMYNEVMNNSALCPELREKYAAAVYAIRTMDPTNYGFDAAPETATKACAKAISEAIGTYEGVMAEIAREKNVGTYGHQCTELPARDATCSENGLTAGSYCVLCGEVVEKQQTLATTGHTFGAEFTEDGVKYKQCSVCDVKIEYQASGVRYANLFSLNRWIKSASSQVFSGTISTNSANGTITIVNENSSEIYTRATYDGQDLVATRDFGNDCIPVTGGKTYVVEATSLASSTSNGDVFVFQYNKDGLAYNAIPAIIGNLAPGETKYVEFTVDANAAYIELRFDANDAGKTITFSQIGVYEKERFDRFGATTADARLGFYPGESKDLCYPNPAPGYTFNGWYTVDGRLIDDVNQLNNPTTIVYGNWIEAGFDVTYDSIFSFSEWAKSSSNQLWYGDIYNLNDDGTRGEFIGNNGGRMVSKEGILADAENGTISITWDAKNQTYADTENKKYIQYCARTNLHIDSGNLHTIPVEKNTEYIIEYTASSTDGGKPNVCAYMPGTGVTGMDAQESGGVTRNGLGTQYFRINTYAATGLTLRFDNVQIGSTVTYSDIAVYKADFEEAARTINNREYRRYYPTKMGIGNVFEYTPTRPGYTFDTWMAETDFEDDKLGDFNMKGFDDTFLVEKNWQLYSTWTENSYTIKYDANGGSGSIADKIAKYTEAVTLPSTGFTRNGYTLAGWSTKADATTATYKAGQSVSRLTGDANGTVTLYAIWQQNTPVNVTFDNMFDYSQFNIGTGSLTVDKRTDTGFIVTSTGGDANTGFSKPIPVEPGKTYIVSADVSLERVAGDTSGYDMYINTQKSDYSGDTSAIVDTTNGAHREGDVYISITGQTTNNKPYIKFTAGSDTRYITVRFDANTPGNKLTVNNIRITEDNGVTVSPANKFVTSYTEYGTLPTPTKVGYTFNGWKHNGTTVNESSIVNSASTVYLKSDWSANKYTIVFNGNGATSGSMANMSMTYDAAAVALNANSFTRTGYTFNGWNTAANGSDTAYTDKQSVKNLTATANGTVTLYAQWKANNYTIKFNSNGGSGSMNDMSMTYGVAKNLTANTFARTGYAFDSWNTKDDGTGTSYENTVSVNNLTATLNGTVTLYAQWKANGYTITYDANGGTVTSSTQAYIITDALNIQTPTRTGYTFNGWSVTSAEGNWTAGTTVNAGKMDAGKYGNVTLTAQWTEKTYTITFNANGGTGSMSDINTFYDDETILPANTFTRVGYTFAGWNTAVNGLGTAYLDKDSVSKLTENNGESVVLFAQWTPITYTIKFNANTASNSMSDMTLTYNESKNLTANAFIKPGYAFMGWSTTTDGEVVYADGASIKNLTTENGKVINLYAVWAQPIVNVTFDNLVDISGCDENIINGTVANSTDTGFTIKSASGAGEAKASTNYFSVTAGQTYVVQIDIKGDNWDVYMLFNDATGTGAGIGFSEDTSRFTSTDAGVEETVDGVTYTAVFKAPAGAERANLRLEANGSNNAVRFDNIRVYDLAEKTYLDTVNKCVKYSETYGELPVPVKPGQVFQGWVDENGNAVTAETLMESTSTVYLKSDWTVNANFANNDTVVVEYGLPVVINVLSNDKLEKVGSVNAIGTTGVDADDLGSRGYTSSKLTDKASPLTLINGSATLNADGTVTYNLSKSNLTAEDVFYYEVVVDGSYYYAKVTVIPATSVYYEDSFFDFADSKVTKGGVDYEYKWQSLGAPVSDLIQSTDRPGAFNFQDDANNLYGYDAHYDGEIAYSGGSAHYTEVDQTAGANGPKATFTFTGTGFDLFTVADTKAGTITVTIYKGDTVDSENRLKAFISNTYYGYKYDDEKGEYITADNGSIYQVPYIRERALDYGTYTVVVQPRYNKYYDAINSGKGGVYVDSVRIFNPMGTDNEIVNEAYKADGEFAPKYLEIRDQLVMPIKDSNGKFTGKYEISSLGNNTAVFLDGGKTTLDDFVTMGPKNEVFLSKSNAISFHIVTDSPVLPATIQLGMRLTGSGGNTATVTLMNANYNGWKENITLNSTTERYYNIESVVDWVLQSDGTYKTAAPVIVRNESDAVISLTSLKWAFDQDLATTKLMLLSDEQTPVLAMAAINRMLDPQPNNTAIDKNNIAYSFSSESYALGETGTLTITTEQGVAGVTVNGAEVVNCEPIENGKLSWTFEFTADVAGNVTYEIVARDEFGNTGETVYAVTFVEGADESDPVEPDDGIIGDDSDDTNSNVGSGNLTPDSFVRKLLEGIFGILGRFLGLFVGGATV